MNILINGGLVHITDNELAVMRGIIQSEYGEQPTDEVWTQYIADDIGMPGLVFSGTVSSLVKKGLVKSHDVGPKAEHTIHLTEYGATVYYASLGLTVPEFK